MWLLESPAALGRILRTAAVILTAALTAACFQPLYGDHPTAVDGNLKTALASVDVQQIEAPNGTPQSRIAVELRNALLFDLTGGSGGLSPTHRLKINMTVSASATSVDVTTGRPETEVTSLNANYTLTELATGKVVVTGSATASVSSDIPGEQQRFGRTRAQRDAETRAAKVVADYITQRISSYMVAKT